MKRRELFDAGYFAPNDPDGEQDIHEEYAGEDDGIYAISRGIGCPEYDNHYVEKYMLQFGYWDCSCEECGTAWIEWDDE